MNGLVASMPSNVGLVSTTGIVGLSWLSVLKSPSPAKTSEPMSNVCPNVSPVQNNSNLCPQPTRRIAKVTKVYVDPKI